MTEPALITKYFTADEVNFTPGERSFVAWVSTEQVDHEKDVVVAAGVDKSVYMTNPVVMCVHDYGKWPAGQCEWLKVKSTAQWTGLYAKAKVDDTPDTETVWKKIQGRTVRAVSIGFLPPPDLKKGEWGPPTADELRKNPHWKGAQRVIRRSLMTEFSICPIGMNPSALIEAVSKGLHKPSYASLEPPVSDETVTKAAPEPECSECKSAGAHFIRACSCGEVFEQCRCTSPDKTREVVENGCASCKAKAAKPDRYAGGDEDTDGADPDPDADAEDEEEEPPVKRGDHVKSSAPHYKGVGAVASVHKDGMVPDVDNEMMGTKAAPACRVKVYRKVGDGHVPTGTHLGIKAEHLEAIDDLKPPKKTKSLAPAPRAETPIDFEISAADIMSDEEARAEKQAALNRLLTSPEFLTRAVRAALDEVTGVV